MWYHTVGKRQQVQLRRKRILFHFVVLLIAVVVVVVVQFQFDIITTTTTHRRSCNYSRCCSNHITSYIAVQAIQQEGYNNNNNNETTTSRNDPYEFYTSQSTMTSSSGGSGGTTTPTTSSSSSSSSSSLLYSTQNTVRYITVTVPNIGQVIGKRLLPGGIDFFGGIPYALPPIGSLRWAPPQPIITTSTTSNTNTNTNTFDATQYQSDCWQLLDPIINPGITDTKQMSEDCLYLNIFTPAGAASSTLTTTSTASSSSNDGTFTAASTSSSTSSGNMNNNNNQQQQQKQQQQQTTSHLKPVLVWLHGGAFQQGGARRPEYDGKQLADRNTIVVTINYRLGALGFLVSSNDGLYGNFGLMDQRAALHWIKKNIQYFGGDPNNVTLFGESAGAVMTLLHLMMEYTTSKNNIEHDTTTSSTNRYPYENRLLHKAIIQSNPLGLQFRSVVVADFIGEAFKRSLDCRDLTCLRAERVEEIMRAQSSLMGIPRSVGDFFTWGPTQTQELKISFGGNMNYNNVMNTKNNRNTIPSSPLSTMRRERDMNSRMLHSSSNAESAWAAVNVTQPLKHLDMIPDDIPLIIGTNKHEGEMFVHGAFPITMTKAVYWMFVGALFRDSASKVLKHYRGYVDQIEKKAQLLSQKQVQEEMNRQFYLENQDDLDREYQYLLELNASKSDVRPGYEALVQAWSRGGTTFIENVDKINRNRRIWWPFGSDKLEREEKIDRAKLREEKKRMRAKERALKEAAKVVVDYRPVMSRIIDDYLFRCPTWHLAHKLSRNRYERGQTNNVYVYQFSHSTHIPGFPECWGKSCHTSEIPFVFQAMDIIRSNYSTLGPHAQKEAPAPPEYPYTDILAAYRDAMDAAAYTFHESEMYDSSNPFATSNSRWAIENSTTGAHPPSIGFQRILGKFFGDYFKEDADEEIASDMADRWVSFAKTGDPNYEASMVQWKPWRYVFDGEVEVEESLMFQSENFDEIFDISSMDVVDQPYVNDTVIEGYYWSDDPTERTYRRRALLALGMEVVDEDVYQTMLRRIKFGEETDNPFHNFLIRIANSHTNIINRRTDKNLRRAVRQLQRIAQDMGFIGTGLGSEARRRDGPASSEFWEDAFFPEIMELKWPPEGRLIERDCTCDMWDKIRYRY